MRDILEVVDGLSLEEVSMGKKDEKLRRLVKKLALRYGDNDPDVVRLKTELDALHQKQMATADHRTLHKPDLDFRSEARRLYHATVSGDTQHR